jgi:hypothetical protein
MQTKLLSISARDKTDIVMILKVDLQNQVIYQGCNVALKRNIVLMKKTEAANRYHLPKEFILNVKRTKNVQRH